MVPRIIHQVWVGPEPLPDEFAAYGATWRRHHPDWEYRLWTDENLPQGLSLAACYERLRSPVERCDLLRLALLAMFGGVYIDTDFECLKPIDPLLEGVDFFIGDLKPGRPNHALMGASPDHPILRRAMGEVKPREFFGYDKAATGPLFFNGILADYDVRTYPPEYFYPSTVSERERAYAIHHAARTWKDERGLRQSLAVAEERLRQTQARLERAEKVVPLYAAAAGRWRPVQNRIVQVARLAPLPVRRIPARALKRWKRTRHDFRRLLDARHRSTYAHTLADVPSRHEFPALLNARGLTGRAVEVGVKIGGYSEFMLKHWEGRELISIDPWLPAPATEYVDKSNVDKDTHERFYERTLARLAKFGERSTIWRMTSLEAAEAIADHSLDFAFIDARHDYESVKEDLQAWFDKIKPGGILAGHDYADGHHPQGRFGVKRAVDEFFAARGLPVHVTPRPDPLFPSWVVEVPRAIGRDGDAPRTALSPSVGRS